jgi:hypothetical protein
MLRSGIRQVRNQSHRGPLVPIAASILSVVAWLVFILLYALFWSKGFSLFQNIIVTIASLLIVGLLIGLLWVVWGFSRGWRRVGMEWGDRP